ncbi:MAG UNVERIFIED_CONTAM: glycosyltransferase family 39 protein [Anaerolineae bacterium]
MSYEGVPLAQPLSLLEIWRQIKAVDPIHPPGYSFLLASWNALTGWSPFSGRTLSFLLGVLSVAMIYRAGRTLFGHSVGLWAAVILATSAFYRHYWHEMRMYTLLVGLHAVVLWAYWQVMVRRPHIWALLALVVGMAGLVYTQYLTVLALVPLGLFHLVWGKKGAPGGW